MEKAKLVLEYSKVFVWPVTLLFILFIFRRQLVSFLTRLRQADLPGGISLKAFDEKIDKAENISIDVSRQVQEKIRKEKKPGRPMIPSNKINAQMLKLDLSPSPSGLELSYYRQLADQDPNLALAGLRIEVELMLKNLVKGFKLKISEHNTAGQILMKLRERCAITSQQYDLLGHMIALCNVAVHGYKVTTEQAKAILDIADVLRDQYVAWLSWGFRKV